jgi:RNA polymerase primary sigma factor
MRMAAIRPPRSTRPSATMTRTIFPEVVEDENATRPTSNLEDKTVTGMLQDMVKHLDREATILRYRFGLDGGSEKTLEEVGENSASPASASGRFKTSPCASCAR